MHQVTQMNYRRIVPVRDTSQAAFARAGLALIFTFGLLSCAADTEGLDGEQQFAPPAEVAEPQLRPLEQELFDIAYGAASEMPLSPHIKNRSRAQESVVQAMLLKGQVASARAATEGIENWRKGLSHGHLALFSALRGDRVAAEEHIKFARNIAANPTEKNVQEWRADRIAARVLLSEELLSAGMKDLTISPAIEKGDRADDEAIRAHLLKESELDEFFLTTDSLMQSGDLEEVSRIMQTLAFLHARLYERSEVRSQIEALVQQNCVKVPLQICVELKMHLAENMLYKGEKESAAAWLTEVSGHMEASSWPPERGLPIEAKLYSLAHRAGDEGSKELLDGLLPKYHQNLRYIVDIYRAGVLRAIAEAYHEIGDEGSCLSFLRMAVDAGVQNPNSRPRAHDLTATCLLLIRLDVEPDEDLMNSLRRVRDGLGDPW